MNSVKLVVDCVYINRKRALTHEPKKVISDIIFLYDDYTWEKVLTIKRSRTCHPLPTKNINCKTKARALELIEKEYYENGLNIEFID